MFNCVEINQFSSLTHDPYNIYKQYLTYTIFFEIDCFLLNAFDPAIHKFAYGVTCAIQADSFGLFEKPSFHHFHHLFVRAKSTTSQNLLKWLKYVVVCRSKIWTEERIFKSTLNVSPFLSIRPKKSHHCSLFLLSANCKWSEHVYVVTTQMQLGPHELKC